MDLDMRLVRYFVAVADELHFGRAAAKLYISQPALSKQIRKLESDIGTQLLVRDSRHVALTPRGELFLEDARQLLVLAERMRHVPETNAVRIAHIFELETSRQVADAFSSEFDGVQLVESSMDSARQLDALLSEQLDVAVLRVTPQMLADRPVGWQRRLIRLEPLRLVGRPGERPGSRSPCTSDRSRCSPTPAGQPCSTCTGSTSRPSSGRPGWPCVGSATPGRSGTASPPYDVRATPRSPSSTSPMPSGTPRPASPCTDLRAAAGLPVVGRVARRHDVGVDQGLRHDCPGDLGAARLAPASAVGRAPDLATVRRPCRAGAAAGLTGTAVGASDLHPACSCVEGTFRAVVEGDGCCGRVLTNQVDHELEQLRIVSQAPADDDALPGSGR